MTLAELKQLEPGCVLRVIDPDTTHSHLNGRHALFVGLTRDGQRARVRLKWFGPAHHANDGYGKSIITRLPQEVLDRA